MGTGFVVLLGMEDSEECLRQVRNWRGRPGSPDMMHGPDYQKPPSVDLLTWPVAKAKVDCGHAMFLCGACGRHGCGGCVSMMISSTVTGSAGSRGADGYVVTVYADGREETFCCECVGWNVWGVLHMLDTGDCHTAMEMWQDIKSHIKPRHISEEIKFDDLPEPGSKTDGEESGPESR